MVKKFAVFVILSSLLLFDNCRSQTGWIQMQTGLTDNFTSVHFYTEMYGMAVSSSGKIIKTTNGGLNWTQLNPGTIMNFSEIRIISPTNAVAAGRQTSNKYLKILRTTNSGLNWDSVYSNYRSDTNVNFHNMKFLTDTSNFGYVSISKTNSGSGDYLKTVNGGLNWTIVTPHIMVYWNVLDLAMISGSVYYCFSLYVYALPPPPVLYNEQTRWEKTTNGGSSWNVQYSSNYTTQSVNYYGGFQANFFNESTGYITYFNTSSVYHQVIGKTTNNGQSFNEISIPMNSVSSVFITGSSSLFLTGVSSAYVPVVAKSTDNGANWQLTAFPGAVNKIYFMNPNTGWISCNNGLLYKTTDGGLVFSKNISSEVPEHFLLFQNHPNPFNPVTKIKFSVPQVRHPAGGSSPQVSDGNSVTLKVYDVTGREVQTLVNDRLQPGTYETTFDGSSLTSGVYFYKMQSESYTETKKMLLLK